MILLTIRDQQLVGDLASATIYPYIRRVSNYLHISVLLQLLLISFIVVAKIVPSGGEHGNVAK